MQEEGSGAAASAPVLFAGDPAAVLQWSWGSAAPSSVRCPKLSQAQIATNSWYPGEPPPRVTPTFLPINPLLQPTSRH